MPPQEFQILYHTNFGTPLLGEGDVRGGDRADPRPFNVHAAEGMGRTTSMPGRNWDFVEQVYKIKPAADGHGRTMALLKNAKGDRRPSLAFDVKQLPYLTQWKNTNAIGEGYVTGIEPGTSFHTIGGGAAARARAEAGGGGKPVVRDRLCDPRRRGGGEGGDRSRGGDPRDRKPQVDARRRRSIEDPRVVADRSEPGVEENCSQNTKA